MNNDDFRKLLATPSERSSSSTEPGRKSKASSAATFTHRQISSAVLSDRASEKKQRKKFDHINHDKPEKEGDDLFDESQARLNEILKNYRDRAAERRKGLGADNEMKQKLTGGYKAVAGSFYGAANSIEEMRRLEIQKSKYLGGDMEHTHLVKGLDYSLLNKVRTEMQETEMTIREREDAELQGNLAAAQNSKAASSRMVANMCKVLFENKAPQRNDLFVRGRMAYVVDLEEEVADVPSTLLRSVVDCPLDQSSENINADNLLISKLTQVLAYLRTDVKKRRKTAAGTEMLGKLGEAMNIFEGVDEYNPGRGDEGGRRGREDSSHGKDGQRRGAASYFDSDKERNRERQKEKREADREERKRERADDESTGKREVDEERAEKIKKRRMEQDDAYAELYPGGLGMLDAGGESDDEADYTKMDMGNRKAPVKRWDFETQDEYEKYQSSREANPKAVYQFGVKTSGGRKTRKTTAAAKERKLDRELEKINKIMETRTKSGTGGKIRY